MLGIHRGLMGYFYTALIIGLVLLILGVILLAVGCNPHMEVSSSMSIGGVGVSTGPHEASLGERAIPLFIGLALAVLGVISPLYQVRKLSGATTTLTRNRPITMLFTTELEYIEQQNGKPTLKSIFATLSLPDPPGAAPNYTRQELMKPMGGRPPEYANVPAQVYIDKDATLPLVIEVNGQYLLTSKAPQGRRPVVTG